MKILTKQFQTKALYFFSVLLIALFPFLNFFYQVFRGVSVSFAHYFERHASFHFHTPLRFQKYIQFSLTDFWIIALMIGAILLKEVSFKKLFFNRHSRYLTLYTLVAFLSIVCSIFSNYFFQYTTLINLTISFIAFHLIYLLFSKRPDFIQSVFWAFVAVATVQCFIGIAQFLTQESLGLRFLSESQVSPYMEDVAIYPLTEKNRALFDKLPWIAENHPAILRSLGTFIHPNVFGVYLNIALFLSYTLFITTVKKGLKVALLITIPLQILSLGLTFSRGSIFAWILGTLVFFIVGLFKKTMFSKQEKRSFFLLFVLVGTGFFLALCLLFDQFIVRGGIMNYTAIANDSDSGRLLYYRIAITLIALHPILGIGFNGYSLFPYETANPAFEGANPIGDSAHNIYLQIGAETGFVGLLLIALFIFSMIALLKKNQMTPIKLALGSILLTFLLLGLVDHLLWGLTQGRLMFFLFSALFAAALTGEKRGRSAHLPSRNKEEAPCVIPPATEPL